MLALMAGIAASVAGCSGEIPDIQIGRIGDPARPVNFRGLIAGDEPAAVIAGQKILLARGNAADAAVAIGFALAVTLPSRAGIRGGGACLVRMAYGATEALVFLPRVSGDQAAPPALPRALFALHARYGVLPWGEVVSPAVALARFGTTVSRALAIDLAKSGDRLLSDGAALAAFMTAERRMLAAGDTLRQPALADELEGVRTPAAQGLSSAAPPQWTTPVAKRAGEQETFTLASSSDAAGDGTGFTVADADGNVVACALTMGKLFGLGRMKDGSLQAPGDLTSVPLNAVITVDRAGSEVRSGAAGVGAAAPANRWSCPNGLTSDGPNCSIATDSERGGYALVVVRDGKM